MKKIEYDRTAEFEKDLKYLKKRFRTLESDLETAKKNTIELYHDIPRIDNRSIFPIPGFCNDEVTICKITKFACKSLKGKGSRSGIRVIYAYFNSSRKVVFIEMYFKSDEELENKERIRIFLKTMKK